MDGHGQDFNHVIPEQMTAASNALSSFVMPKKGNIPLSFM
jgi:hypothetical protein